jgi:hypothetical protein
LLDEKRIKYFKFIADRKGKQQGAETRGRLGNRLSRQWKKVIEITRLRWFFENRINSAF